jgi:glycosyltransferase involved in cell wall biosynthesis
MRHFDITRLCKRATSPGPSGIDRVDLAYLKWLRSLGSVTYMVNGVAGFSVIDHRLGDAFVEKLEKMWQAAGEPFTQKQLHPFQDTARRLRMAGKWRARRQRLSNIQNTDCLLTLCTTSMEELDLLDAAAGEKSYRVDPSWRSNKQMGCFFGISHAMLSRTAYLSALARNPLLKRVFFIHDTIPCDYPEYCREHEGAKHLLRLRNVFRYGTHIVVNSEYTARRLENWRLTLDMPELPVAVIPIGVDEGLLRHASYPPSPFPPARPYFVMLSTIEPRKNHSLLLQIWRHFAETMAPEDVPELVLIGKRGWENEAVFRLLDRCEILRPHVREMNGVPDEELWPLLRDARAMLFPSFAEGWGMPMVEALALGVPVIASDIPPFLEAGQGIPELISPLDGLNWAETILDYTSTSSPRRLVQFERLQGYRPPTWQSHFEKLHHFVDCKALEADE